MKRLVCLAFLLAACGDNIPAGSAIDARIDSPTGDGSIDASPDAMIDAPIDAMPTPSERIALARAAADGAVTIDIVDATITYIKPAVTGATLANDPAGFTVQAGPTGPALMVAADVTTLTPAPVVGDVVSFQITTMATTGNGGSGMLRYAATIANYTRTTAATNIAALVQDVGAATDIVSAIGNYESEVVNATLTIVEAFGNSGSGFSRARVTSTGIPTLDNNFQLRLPTTLKDALNLEVGCVVRVNRTPVNRFGAQAQLSAFVAADLTITSCTAPTVTAAVATTATSVTVTFSRDIDTATVLANGSQFTINGLAVTAAVLATPRTVTLTTAAQTSGTAYTVTVANTVEDTLGTALGAPLTANFTGFAIVIPSVMMAVADSATSVKVTFTRAIDAATVVAAGTQFTIDNGLTVSAATVAGLVVTLTTSAQTPGTMYTVTVANTVEDTDGTPIGAPLTAMFNGFTPSAGVDHLVINEIDYDQAATDAASFIEIYNPTAAAIPLANFAVVYVNGGSTGGPNGTVYPNAAARVLLSAAGTELAAGGYLVIRNATVTVPSGTLTIDVTGDFLQNGADGVALINTSTNTLVDTLHYAHLTDGVGAGITTATIMGFAATVSLVEGPAPFATADTTTGSLARTPNGKDTNIATADWALATTPTPGATN